jgi:hypothetical protein
MIHKQGSLLADKPVVLIIGIVVFISLLFFILRADVLEKIKLFLPDFSSEDKDLDVIDSGDSSGEGSSLADSLKFIERTEGEILFALIYGGSNLGKCSCGKECGNYSKWIVEYSKKYGIPDALIIASLIMQESACDKSASSESSRIPFEKGASYGLMQISGRIWCGENGGFGLPEEKEECKKFLLENPEKNIEIGVKILKNYYDYDRDSYESKIKSNCNDETYQNIYLSYTGWKKALRLYNGPACRDSKESNYVNEVVARYNELNNVLNKKFQDE